MQAGIFIHSI